MVGSGSVNSWEFRGYPNCVQGRGKKDNFVERVRREGWGLIGRPLTARAAPATSPSISLSLLDDESDFTPPLGIREKYGRPNTI